MKKRILLVLLAALLLSGCRDWRSGDSALVVPHEGQYTQTEPLELVRVSTYEQIRSTLSGMADGAVASCVLGVDDYQGDLEQDMSDATAYALERDPLGAYAFSRLTYRFDRIGNQNVVLVDALYRHSRTEIEAIEQVRYGSAMDRKVAEALDTFAPSLTIWVSGYEDTDFAEKVKAYCDENPDKIMEYPSISVEIYPDSGASRVVELNFNYKSSRDSMWNMQGAVETIFASADGYVSLAEDEYTKAERLCSFLLELFRYTPGQSITPSYSLLCQGVSDSTAFSNVFAAMCRRAGLWCQRVDGRLNGEDWSWNILKVNDTYTYVDLMSGESYLGTVFRGDKDMEGYEWDREGYPECQVVWPTMAYHPPAEETEPASAELPPAETGAETEPQARIETE